MIKGKPVDLIYFCYKSKFFWQKLGFWWKLVEWFIVPGFLSEKEEELGIWEHFSWWEMVNTGFFQIDVGCLPYLMSVCITQKSHFKLKFPNVQKEKSECIGINFEEFKSLDWKIISKVLISHRGTAKKNFIKIFTGWHHQYGWNLYSIPPEMD